MQIPTRATGLSPEDSVVIKMPPTPSPTPRRVNFSLTSTSPGPGLGPTSSAAPPRGKSSLKNLIPKVGFKPKTSHTDIEKGQGDVSSPSELQEKASISRSLSLSKLFTPRIKRTSSLPVTPIVLSKSESAHGGSSATPQTPRVSKLSFVWCQSELSYNRLGNLVLGVAVAEAREGADS